MKKKETHQNAPRRTFHNLTRAHNGAISGEVFDGNAIAWIVGPSDHNILVMVSLRKIQQWQIFERSDSTQPLSSSEWQESFSWQQSKFIDESLLFSDEAGIPVCNVVAQQWNEKARRINAQRLY